MHVIRDLARSTLASPPSAPYRRMVERVRILYNIHSIDPSGGGGRVAGIVEQSPWNRVFERAHAAQTIFLLGATDTGKTTFLAWLANALHAQGRRVAIVDADVGQSSVGPPTTIGLGLVAHPIERAQDLVPLGMYFVGSVSPRGHLLPVVVGTKRMVDRGRALGVDHVLVDTCGFIAGSGGRALKLHKIDLVAPDLIVCFQRAGECEGILRAYRRSQRPQVLRLQAAIACRQRSMADRRLYRECSLQRYFANAQPLILPWDELNLVDTPFWRGVPLSAVAQARLVHLGIGEVLWAEQSDDELLLVTQERLAARAIAEIEQVERRRVQVWIAAELQGTLLGLLDEAGEMLGLGLLQGIDFARRRLTVLAPRCERATAGIRWSRTRLGHRGELHGGTFCIPQGIESIPEGES